MTEAAFGPVSSARKLKGRAPDSLASPFCLLTSLALGAFVAYAPELGAAELPASVEVVRREEPILMRPDALSPRRGAAVRGARLPVYGVSEGPGCADVWYSIGPVAWICAEGALPSSLPPSTEHPARTPSGLPFPYYFVGKDGSFGYRVLETAEEGVPEAQLLPGFGVATPRIADKPETSDPFGLSTHGLWIPLRDLNGPVVPPGPLAAELEAGEVAWVIGERAPIFASPGGRRQRGEELVPLSQVRVFERAERGREAWLRIGEATWIRARSTTSPRPAPVPAEARPGERWIDVDLERQVVTAYQGERALFAMPVSTGRGAPKSELATPPGVHRLWIKLATSDMDNLENLEASEVYAIQAVPWVMYFERGYGLHGTFWHRAFGRVQSHGCVNLTPKDAERLFDWTSPRLPPGWSAVLPTDYEAGTIVRVR
jgi:hypothetical protein